MFARDTNNGKLHLPGSRTLFTLGSVFVVVLVAASTLLTFIHFSTGMHAAPTKPGIAKATQAPQPTATPQSTVIKSEPSFSFTAAGDYGQTSYTTANLDRIAKSGVKFHLPLGDFDYYPNTSAAAWSTYAI